MLDGKYPLITGLEHDEHGHPTGNPKLHMAMTAKRRSKLRKLAEEIPPPEVYGDEEGETLLVGWGSTYGPIHDAVKRARGAGEKIGAIHLRHVHPLPNGLEKIFPKFRRIVVVEMNDQGIYGFGQLATILRARYCEPKIESLTKTDGLTYRVREILEGIFKRPFSRNGAAAKPPHDPQIAAATDRAQANVSPATAHAFDNTPTMPGAEAADAAAGTNESRPDAAQAL
jgi:2-oxoglutarate ferredoxin oxidoreductase subunit alpha